jgi:hypothetical protein
MRHNGTEGREVRSMYRRRFPVADMAPSPRATTGKELLGISEPLLSMRATAMRLAR